MKPEHIYIKDYQYSLPPERIAVFPLEERHLSKLLVYKSGKIEESIFKELASHLPAGSLLVLNNTRVIEARVLFQKPTGGVIEVFCLEPAKSHQITEAMMATGSCRWQCLIGGASKWKPGQILEKELLIESERFTLQATYIEKKEDAFIIEFSWGSDFSFGEILHAAGAVPLPPYIKRKAESIDAERYQTIFAQHQGSVAAPTAALHFSSHVFHELQQKNIHKTYVTLHVGAGTFKPVKTETIAEHQMHAEQFHVHKHTLQQLQQASTIIAVGTTSLRTLESLYWIGIKLSLGHYQHNNEIHLAQWEAYELSAAHGHITYQQSISTIIDYLTHQKSEELVCRTSLIITPGYTFKSADALITNFHQPQSTLLLLVAAFIGADWKKVYDYALSNDFRFLSYGDSSLLWRNEATG